MRFCGECGAQLPAPDAPCPACTAPKAADDPNREGDIPIFFWCGQKRYRCPLIWESGAACDYDTYDIDAMRDHIGQPHTASGKPRTGRATVSPLFDHEGKQIIHAPIEEREIPEQFRNLKFKQ